jgi:peroxiredoxin
MRRSVPQSKQRGALQILTRIGTAAVILTALSACQPDRTSSAPATPYPTPAPVTFTPPTLYAVTPQATILHDHASVVGEPAPDLTLSTLDSGTLRLRDLQGQVVFLNFWATWCAPCQDEMPELQQIEEEHRAEGVRVVAVTDPTQGQTEDGIRTFLLRLNLKLTVALSSDPDLYEQFGVAQIPTTFIIDRAGIIREEHIGELHPDDITAYLDELVSN